MNVPELPGELYILTHYCNKNTIRKAPPLSNYLI